MSSQALVAWRAADHAIVPFCPGGPRKAQAPAGAEDASDRGGKLELEFVRRGGMKFVFRAPKPTEDAGIVGMVIVCCTVDYYESMCETFLPERRFAA